MDNFKEKINDMWWATKAPFKTFGRGVKNLWTWRKIIWNDRQWDYAFFYDILYKKLEVMEEYFSTEENCWSVNHLKYAEDIKKTRLALKRLIDDDYSPYREMDKKWGEIEMWTTPTDREDLVECNIRRVKECNLADMEKCGKDTIKTVHAEEALRKQDLEYVFSRLSKHIRSWWD